MPYKVFAVGAEALAADANNMLMEQTVARFTNAGQRSTDLVAPELNQLSMLDNAAGNIQYWNGSAWANLSPTVLVREATLNFGGMVSTNQNLSLSVFTMPITGTIVLEGIMALNPGNQGPFVLVPLLSPGVSTPSGTGPTYPGIAANSDQYYGTIPFRYVWSNVAAGTACNLCVGIASNTAPRNFTVVFCEVKTTIYATAF